jgi:hypothetical protein
MPTRPTWTEISLSLLAENYRIIREHVGPGHAMLAVVKADSYGHGIARIATTLARLGADWFGVTSADEGVELRQLGIRQPILLLTGFWEGEQSALTDYDLVPAIYSEDQLATIEAWGLRGPPRHPPQGEHRHGDVGPALAGRRAFVKLYRGISHVEMTSSAVRGCWGFTTHQIDGAVRSSGAGIARAGIHLSVVRPTTRPLPYGPFMGQVRPGLLLYGYQFRREFPRGSGASQPRSCSHEILSFKTRSLP